MIAENHGYLWYQTDSKAIQFPFHGGNKQFSLVIIIALLLEDIEHLTHKLAHSTAFKQKTSLKIPVCIRKVKQKSINSNN